MWSGKNKLTASEVTVGSSKKAVFVCPDCGKEFKAMICNVVCSVENDCTGCYDCSMKRINAISKPECFVVRLMLAFAGENGIANPFADVRNILGENSLLGLDFVDHIQKLCGEYNGVAWHGDDEHVLTPPTIEIVGFLGGSCKAHHHAACQVASYAVSHKKPRVWLSMSIQPLQVDQHTCLRSRLFECILL